MGCDGECGMGPGVPLAGRGGFVGQDGTLYIAIGNPGVDTPALAGLGTPGWTNMTNGCGLFRGPTGQIYYLEKTGRGWSLCDVKTGIAVCNPLAPVGLWTRPLYLTGIAQTTAGATTVADIANWYLVKLFDPAPSVIQALSAIIVTDATTGLEVGDQDIAIGGWATGVSDQMFPQWGNNTVPTYLVDQRVKNIPLPLRMFGEQVLTDGQNNLPNAMAAVNLNDSETGFTFRVQQLQPRTVNVLFKVYQNFAAQKPRSVETRHLAISAAAME